MYVCKCVVVIVVFFPYLFVCLFVCCNFCWKSSSCLGGFFSWGRILHLYLQGQVPFSRVLTPCKVTLVVGEGGERGYILKEFIPPFPFPLSILVLNVLVLVALLPFSHHHHQQQVSSSSSSRVQLNPRQNAASMQCNAMQ